MKKYFVWTRDIERMIDETLSGKTKRRASNGDVLVKLFARVAEASENYYSSMSTLHVLSRDLKYPNKSSIFRMFERNERLWKGVGLVFDALELQKVHAAPDGSIVMPTFGVGGYSFEVVVPSDPDYIQAFTRLPGAT